MVYLCRKSSWHSDVLPGVFAVKLEWKHRNVNKPQHPPVLVKIINNKQQVLLTTYLGSKHIYEFKLPNQVE